MTDNEKFTMIAKWIHSECDRPVSEIEWLLKEYCEYDIENLESEYYAVFEWKKEKEK